MKNPIEILLEALKEISEKYTLLNSLTEDYIESKILQGNIELADDLVKEIENIKKKDAP